MKSIVEYINEGKKSTINIKAEVEEYVKSKRSEIEEWITDTYFVDNNGCGGHIFKSEKAAYNAVLRGNEHQNALDYVECAMSDDEWVSYLVRGGVDKAAAEKIIERGQWNKVVKTILDADGAEWFLSQYSGTTHELSNGYILYY